MINVGMAMKNTKAPLVVARPSSTLKVIALKTIDQTSQKREDRISAIEQLREKQQHRHNQHMVDVDSRWIR